MLPDHGGMALHRRIGADIPALGYLITTSATQGNTGRVLLFLSPEFLYLAVIMITVTVAVVFQLDTPVA